MKKLLLVGAVALFGAMNAQTKFGVKAGYTNSQFSSDESMEFEDVKMDKKGKSGFFVGGFVEHMLSEKFALQGELTYAALGGKYEGKFNDSGYYATLVTDFKVNQIIIPISAKYYVIPNLAIYGGPNVGFTVSNEFEAKLKDSNLPSEAISEANSSLSEYNSEASKEFDKSLQKTTFGIQLGAEYNVYKGLLVDARYNIGLTDLDKGSESNIKMHYFQIGLGYKF